MRYAESGGPIAPAVTRRASYAAPLRRTRDSAGVLNLSAETVQRVAPGIRPELISAMYEKGLRVEFGPTPYGGTYTPSTRSIRLSNAGRLSPSDLGTRGSLEHELRHSIQNITPGAVGLGGLTSLNYQLGRVGQYAFQQFPNTPYGNAIGSILAPYSEGFANYREPAYAGAPTVPLSAYQAIASNVPSVKSLTAWSQRARGGY